MSRTDTTITSSRSATRGNASRSADTQEMDLGVQDRQITLEGDMSIEELRDSLNARVTLDVGTPDFKDHAENLAFMEERVLVRVMESADKNAEKIVEVFNDGVPQRFVRGQWQIAKRKFVEVLARAKPFSVQTPEMTDGNGNRTTAINVSHGLRYPFEMRDDNPRGQAWLQGVIQEA